ncbi:MAG: hypothetical protein O4861_05995 [Trichodesmium sp. St16_bin4-tuft]|nr:hypothetical protein [Trichodesmium sp. MAG_R01]MDE5072990.1 hypothetical protein [Trichodesmium sp. St5_bin8]MDE5077757.1 hypothetical protein [Trichodesmium sp. St2_bin6]MDE5097911.1 hypothetical protein [Trichodesmium sp. St16_bin4-tuft]MDE5103951.1 hypothetical protein [Trichodesmium sp. St19_bin2]
MSLNTDLQFFILKYEDFVEDNLKAFSHYLGIEIDINKEVQVPPRVSRVARSKTHGDWKNCFNQGDVDTITPSFKDFIEEFGYNTEFR